MLAMATVAVREMGKTLERIRRRLASRRGRVIRAVCEGSIETPSGVNPITPYRAEFLEGLALTCSSKALTRFDLESTPAGAGLFFVYA